ncbi:Hypothetical predicted protein [Paramuricea clavata]|uniref:Uncharacterized protein n=2 Tax=Paramuricea clavata TaxID=317549 RepID=A0A7D9L130_PARCT|nr:Hypothetical predicted protein [Paramuricea clavata]
MKHLWYSTHAGGYKGSTKVLKLHSEFLLEEKRSNCKRLKTTGKSEEKSIELTYLLKRSLVQRYEELPESYSRVVAVVRYPRLLGKAEMVVGK